MPFKQNADTFLIVNVLSAIWKELVKQPYATCTFISHLDVVLTALLQPECPICHVPLTIDLEAPPIELENNEQAVSKVRQGMLGRLNLETWRSSTKIEALIEELSNLRQQDATTKSIVFSQFVNFLDLIAYRLQRAGFTVRVAHHNARNITDSETDMSTRGDYEPGRSGCYYSTLQ
jgi:hypothetical protein